MINSIYIKTLILTPADKNTGALEIKTNANPSVYGKEVKRDSELFYQNYGSIALQNGLTKDQFLSDEYKELREAAYSVCKDKVVLEVVQGIITNED